MAYPSAPGRSGSHDRAMDVLVSDAGGLTLKGRPAATGSRHQRITNMSMLLDPRLAEEEMNRRRGHKPKNHLSINRRKATQVRREAPPEAAPTPSTAAEKKKYDHVESKVAAFTKVAARQTEEKKDYLRRHSRNGAPSQPNQPTIGKPQAVQTIKTAFGRSQAGTSGPDLSISGGAVGLSRPGSKAASTRPSSRPGSRPGSSQSTRPGTRGTKPGEIPAYLKARKAAWKREDEAQRAAAERDPNCPDGFVQLDEGKRREIIKDLRQRYERLSAALQMLPTSKDTLRLQQCRQVMERDLRGLELAMEYFTAPRVYVPGPHA